MGVNVKRENVKWVRITDPLFLLLIPVIGKLLIICRFEKKNLYKEDKI